MPPKELMAFSLRKINPVGINMKVFGRSVIPKVLNFGLEKLKLNLVTMNAEQIKVMVVEDDDAIREGIIDLLTLEGYQVGESSNGKEALELMMDYQPDLVISDIMMPVMDGHSLLKAYREMEGAAEIPFIFLSALTDKNDVRKGMSLGAEDYLTKPFSRAELIEAITVQYEKFYTRKRTIEEQSEAISVEKELLAQKEKEVLVKEMHHRVKHNLAVISAFFELGELSDNPEFMHSIKDRVLAMASVHEEAYANEMLCRVNSKKLINNVLDNMFGYRDVTFTRQLEEMEMDISRAIPLGLLLHEFLALLFEQELEAKRCRIDVKSYKLLDKASLVIGVNCECETCLQQIEDDVRGLLIQTFVSQLNGELRTSYSEFGTLYQFVYELA